MEKTCTIEGCDNGHWSRGLCKKHYAAWRRGGQKEALREARSREIRVCAQCGGPIPPERRNGVLFCGPQCKRRAQHEKETASPPPRRNRPCSVDGCESSLLAKGLCAKHYNRLRNKGSLDDVRRNQRGFCSIEGCERPTVGRGLCDRHYRAAISAEKREQRKQQPDDRSCFHCGGSMDGRNGGAMFCSVDCKRAERTASGVGAADALRSYFGRQYGLKPEWVDENAVSGCQICGTFDWGGRHNRPNVDHCHKTGKVRGVLCSECNNGMGKFHDDPALLQKAIDYLARS